MSGTTAVATPSLFSAAHLVAIAAKDAKDREEAARARKKDKEERRSKKKRSSKKPNDKDVIECIHERSTENIADAEVSSVV